MSITLDEFIQSVTTSELMDAAEIQSFLETLPMEHRPTTAEDLAKELYRAGKLTKFQTQAIYQKKTRGLVVDNYVVLDKLGKGGMGAVYKAQHKRMKRVVALKMLPSSATKSADAVKRFQREVEAAAKLSHPNIVTAFDADEAKGVHFLVMEYVEGHDLHAFVKEQGTVSVARAVDYIVQAAKGLEYAHSQGVIHRDIKPHNLLLDKKGTVKILDMGLARIEEAVAGTDATANEGLTQSGQVMGTLDYMPPEQALDTSTVDVRADIYSLGCTLYYLLAGRPPYTGDTVGKKIVAHREQPIPSLRQLRSDVPQSLDAIFQKMLAKQPKDRQHSMTEAISQLQGCTLNTGLAAPPSFPPSSGSYAETVALHQEDTEPPTELPLSPLDELFASEPIQITERLVAPSFLYKKRWTKQQKLVIPAVAGGVAALLVVMGLVLTLGGRKGAKESIGVVQDATKKPPPQAIAPFDATKARQYQEAWSKHLGVPVEEANSIGMELILIPPGEFMMGSTPEQVARAMEDGKKKMASEVDLHTISCEGPQHRVEITKPFHLGAYEVTQAEYEQVVGSNPSHFKGDVRLPVENFSWFDAVAFCNRLSERERIQPYYKIDGETVSILGGNGYRLPTEAEREYACRAGTATKWSLGDDESKLGDYAWWQGNSGDKTHEVGEKKPNQWGLYDMHGNVWEWCWDWVHEYEAQTVKDPMGPCWGERRVFRGGCLCDPPMGLSVGHRNGAQPSFRSATIGFRLARTYSRQHSDAKPSEPSTTSSPAASSDKPVEPSGRAVVPSSETPPSLAVAPFDAAQARKYQEAWSKHLRITVEITNSIGMKLILIPPGEFLMGSAKEFIKAEQSRGGDNWLMERLAGEGPQHQVRITLPLWIGATEVTQAEYRQVVGSDPSDWKGDSRRPVEHVSWEEATEFCRRLSEVTDEKARKRHYQLPTEAQWEYACRAGTSDARFFNPPLGPPSAEVSERLLAEYGWFAANSGGQPRPVGQKLVNPWGLYDVYGNVWEWCQDRYDPSYYAKSPRYDPSGPSEGSHRVLRGGGFDMVAGQCRSASRLHFQPDFHACLGFRVCLVPRE